MRLIAIIGLALAAAAVVIFLFMRAPPPAEQVACVRSAQHAAAFSDAQATDMVTGASTGPSCAEATLSLTVANAAGEAMWRYEAPYVDLAYGSPRPEGVPVTSDAEMDSFLTQWADVTAARASSLPAWPEGAARLSLVDNGGLLTDTPMRRADYEALRDSDVRTLCYAASMDVTHCIAFDTPSGKARLVAAFGPRGVDLRMPQ